MIASYIVRCVVLLSLALLAACATPTRPTPGGAPHYKVGAPYSVNGKIYQPRADPNYVATGIASWYGDEFHGRRTANGEIFDKNRLSAAHTTLPLPSIVEVENLENGRRITVRVNDRGPFVGDRLIDLSHGAARALGFDRQGLARVRVRYHGRADLAALAPRYGDNKARRVRVATAVSPTPATMSAPADDPMARLIATALAAPPIPTLAPTLAPTSTPPAAPLEYWIAVAQFADLNQLESARLTLAANSAVRVVPRPGEGGRFAYGLEVGPFHDVQTAAARLAALREAGYPGASLDADALCVGDIAAC